MTFRNSLKVASVAGVLTFTAMMVMSAAATKINTGAYYFLPENNR